MTQNIAFCDSPKPEWEFRAVPDPRGLCVATCGPLSVDYWREGDDLMAAGMRVAEWSAPWGSRDELTVKARIVKSALLHQWAAARE